MSWHPTLDNMESHPDGPYGHGPDRTRSRDNRDPETVAKEGKMGSGRCWCGFASSFHTWPGSGEGAPHPRDWPGKAEGQPYTGSGDLDRQEVSGGEDSPA